VAQDWTDEYRPGYHRLSVTTRWRFSLLSTYIGFFTGGLEKFEEVARFSSSYLDHFAGSFAEEPETFGIRRIVPMRWPITGNCRTAGSTCRKKRCRAEAAAK